MADKSKRRRANLIHTAPRYTREDERKPREPEEPEAAAAANPTPAPSSSSNAAPEPQVTSPESPVRTRPAPASNPETNAAKQEQDGYQGRVGFYLTKKTNERLKAFTSKFGAAPDEVIRALTPSIMPEVYERMAGPSKPATQDHGGRGDQYRVGVTLRGTSYKNAQKWFDPMELGVKKVTKGTSTVLAEVFERHVKQWLDKKGA